MPIWLEAVLGLDAVALCAVACWYEDKLVAWEDKHFRRWANQLRIKSQGGTPMKRFKVGDHVRGTAGSTNMFTGPDLIDAVVTDLNPDGDIRIRVIRHTEFDAGTMPEFEVSAGEIELIEEGDDPMPIHTAKKKILDVTCGSRSIWFDKHHPAAIYCDNRKEEMHGIWKSTNRDSQRSCIIDPDIQCDFTDLPFDNNTFALVVWDPPHLRTIGENAWLAKKYGRLDDNWPEMLRDGFRECMRVLKPDGVLIFKWAETQIPAADVWKAIGEKPLFGHHSGKRSQTFWACFMKIDDSTQAADTKTAAPDTAMSESGT